MITALAVAFAKICGLVVTTAAVSIPVSGVIDKIKGDS